MYFNYFTTLQTILSVFHKICKINITYCSSEHNREEKQTDGGRLFHTLTTRSTKKILGTLD